MSSWIFIYGSFFCRWSSWREPLKLNAALSRTSWHRNGVEQSRHWTSHERLNASSDWQQTNLRGNQHSVHNTAKPWIGWIFTFVCFATLRIFRSDYNALLMLCWGFCIKNTQSVLGTRPGFLHSRRPNFWLKTSRTNAEAQSWTVVAGFAAVSPSTPDPAVTWRMLNKC